jgi:hypothetical protein
MSTVVADCRICISVGKPSIVRRMKAKIFARKSASVGRARYLQHQCKQKSHFCDDALVSHFAHQVARVSVPA